MMTPSGEVCPAVRLANVGVETVLCAYTGRPTHCVQHQHLVAAVTGAEQSPQHRLLTHNRKHFVVQVSSSRASCKSLRYPHLVHKSY